MSQAEAEQPAQLGGSNVNGDAGSEAGHELVTEEDTETAQFEETTDQGEDSSHEGDRRRYVGQSLFRHLQLAMGLQHRLGCHDAHDGKGADRVVARTSEQNVHHHWEHGCEQTPHRGYTDDQRISEGYRGKENERETKERGGPLVRLDTDVSNV